MQEDPTNALEWLVNRAVATWRGGVRFCRTMRDNREARAKAIAALAIAALLAAIFLVTGCSGREEQQSFKPTRPFVVTFQAEGDSMLGTFPSSHVAAVDVAYPYDDLQAGDIVLRWDYVIHDYTLHRLVSKDGEWWTARGDNNPSNDTAFVTPVTYVGMYVDTQPNR